MVVLAELTLEAVFSDLKKSVEKLKKLDVKTIYPGHGMIDNNGKKSIEMSYSLF